MYGTLIQQPFANSGDITVPPQTDPSGFVNWAQGYTPFYEIQIGINPQAKAVERPIQNALFNILTGNQNDWQRYGYAQWYSSMPGGYSKNAFVVRLVSGTWKPYRSLIDSNSDDPASTPASWAYLPTPAEATLSVPMPAGGAVGSTGEVITVATDFNTFGTGTWEFKTDAIAVGSPNSPAPSGGAAAAGLLESKVWTDGTHNYTVQRYLDRNSFNYYRSATDGAWSAWTVTASAASIGGFSVLSYYLAQI